ncbi:MAG: hypothetical protein BMS9Abin07_0130 [Acidimicrobiia bacterium]|nr:MAG: hypothetical protein BMS9Abin07_0130 [Acidimicrobiia bacterium]
MKDITILIPERGGAVPEIWEALAAADINVEAAVSFSREHHRVVHVVVEDAVADRAQEVLTGADFLTVDAREVLVVPLEDRPGGLASVARTAYEASAGVYLLSLATGDRVMLGVANLEAARQAFDL